MAPGRPAFGRYLLLGPLLALAGLSHSQVHAQERPAARQLAPTHAAELQWEPSWSKVGPFDYALALWTFGATVTIEFTVDARKEPKIEGGFLFDDAVRDALVLKTRSARNTAGLVSDATFYGATAYPILVDVAGVTWLGHGRGDIAWQMLVMDLEAMGSAVLVARIAQKLGGRERPLTDECLAEGGRSYHKFCPGNPDSLISGHTAMAFAGAALTCAHHRELPLYGGGWGDDAVCFAMLGAATATGVLRVNSDMHYASDVLMGAGLGLAAGYLLPSWLHYTHLADGDLQAYLAPYLDRGAVGLSLLGYQR